MEFILFCSGVVIMCRAACAFCMELGNYAGLYLHLILRGSTHHTVAAVRLGLKQQI
jgi:hypothetical protein